MFKSGAIHVHVHVFFRATVKTYKDLICHVKNSGSKSITVHLHVYVVMTKIDAWYLCIR